MDYSANKWLIFKMILMNKKVKFIIFILLYLGYSIFRATHYHFIYFKESHAQKYNSIWN